MKMPRLTLAALLWLCAPAFVLGAALPSRVHAQLSPNLTLQIDPLSCPQCTCDDARARLEQADAAYRQAHQRVSKRGPIAMMFLGYGASAGVLAGTAMLTVFGLMWEEPGHQKRVMARQLFGVAALVFTVPLSLGVAGTVRLFQRREEAIPYEPIERERIVELKEAKRFARQTCRR
jgi:hypothetical protein